MQQELEEQYQEDMQQAELEGKQSIEDAQFQYETQTSKIEIEVSGSEVKNFTRILIDVLDYYSNLPDRQEKMKMLVKATETSNKLTKSYYS